MSENLLKIDKGIEIPPKIDRSAKCKYPFGEMEVGDSFFVPNVRKSFSIYNSLNHFNSWNLNKIKVIQRREGNGVRVWRIL